MNAAEAALKIVDTYPDAQKSFWLKKHIVGVRDKLTRGVAVQDAEVEAMLCQYRDDTKVEAPCTTAVA